MPALNETEVRVLGSLVEKQLTTPEYYPLTLNALTAACNQKSNRQPVVSYDEATVERALESLRAKNLVYVFYGSTSRAPKYKHLLPEVLHLTPPETALLCALMLRGPQTTGELRGRTERLYEFSGLEEIEETLDSLSAKEPEALVTKLPRQPGQKEARYAHLLSGVPEVSLQAAKEPPEANRAGEAGERAPLEQEVADLRAALERLRSEFEEFKKQFD